MRDADADRLVAFVVIPCLLATLAFAAYSRTLLPGLDFGDTGSVQASVASGEPRIYQAYPLYFAAARPFVAATSPANPARALNLFSAIWAAAAVGLLALVTARVLRAPSAGAFAGLLLAFSYTFWTQAVIAEVYTLHLALIALCLVALEAWARRPTQLRLAVFFAVYALSFGNHLGMILLFPPFAAFLWMTHPAPRHLLRSPTVLMAVTIAAAAALQYTPTVRAAMALPDAPAAWMDRLAFAWSSVTMAEWRHEMVLGVGSSALPDRLAMWWWDMRQQIGTAGAAIAAIGLVRLWRIARPWAMLTLLAYAITTLFALTYNVGDPHVFFLPGHVFVAFAAGAALASLAAFNSRSARPRHRAVAVVTLGLALLYPAWRGWDTWPAADRRGDTRAEDLVGRLVFGLNDRTDAFIPHADWQLETAVSYVVRQEHPMLPWRTLGDVLADFPAFLREQHAAGRDVVLTGRAAAEVVRTYGTIGPLVRDSIPQAVSLPAAVASMPRGTPYVLVMLAPGGDAGAILGSAIGSLTGGRIGDASTAPYEVIAGLSGEAPTWRRMSERPFRETFSLLGDRFTVRMDAWLPLETFRRGGFGHVLRGRDRVLFAERGASLVWFRPDGSPVVAYAHSLYEPLARFRIPAELEQLARRQ